MFIVASNIRCRSAWLTNYLTWQDTFCLHDGLKEGKLDFDFPDVECVGLCDPAAVLVQDKLIAKYPEAEWVIIDREYKDVQESVRNLGLKPDLFLTQTKLEELRGKVDALVIKFDEIDSRIIEIAQYVNPDWKHCQQRHDMILGMNVQVDVERALKDITERASISHLVEPATFSDDSREYLNVIKELCSPEPYAYEWFYSVVNAALVWDHIMDCDAQNLAAADQVMYQLVTEWPLNPFLNKYAKIIIPTVSACISAWKESYRDGVSKEFAYLIYSELPAAMAFIIGGNQRVNQFMPIIRPMVKKLCESDMRRDGGRK